MLSSLSISTWAHIPVWPVRSTHFGLDVSSIKYVDFGILIDRDGSSLEILSEKTESDIALQCALYSLMVWFWCNITEPNCYEYQPARNKQTALEIIPYLFLCYY